MKFIDEVDIAVSSGHGGAGCVSFRREMGAPRGGPDGGDGGAGGNVIFRVTKKVHSLLDLRFCREYLAGDGEPGSGQNCTGARGNDAIIPVPVGTVIKDGSGQLIEDLSEEQDFVFLKGGRGGKGNNFFKTSVNQAPLHAQPGEDGEKRELHLELKLLADVGIVGFPNAGKSTLISRISAARPKIADYPFTTLVPNLGVVRMDENHTFVVADIPGLIQGAHEGVGLGTQFLRHIERTKVFVHMIDASPYSGRDPVQDYHDIIHELKSHDLMKRTDPAFRPLADRAQLVVLNKVEMLTPEELKELVAKFAKMDILVHPISAATAPTLQPLIYKMGEFVFANQE